MDRNDLRLALREVVNEAMNEPVSAEGPMAFIDAIVSRIVERLKGECPTCGRTNDGND